MNKGLYVQFGCGSSTAEGWLNFDSSPTLRVENFPLIGYVYSLRGRRFPRNAVYGDIVKGLPLPHGSCAAIYSSHVLEHLSLTDCRRALQNTFALLRPGGVFRLIVPNLAASIKAYLEDTSETAAEEFMRYTGLGVERRPRDLVSVLRELIGGSRHLWMWDYNSMRFELETAGFSNIRPCTLGDSSDPMFKSVENEGRYAYDALAIECIKL